MTVKCTQYDSFVTNIFYTDSQKRVDRLCNRPVVTSLRQQRARQLRDPASESTSCIFRKRRPFVALTFLCIKFIFYPIFSGPEWANIKAENAMEDD